MPALPPFNPFRPPPGYTVLGHDGDSTGRRMLVSSGITIAFAILAVAGRMAAKATVIRELDFEDYLVLVALLTAIVRTAMWMILVNDHQLGQHAWDVSVANINTIYVWGKATLILYFVAIFCAKTSILLSYDRLFGVKKWFRALCYALIAVVGSYCLILTFTTAFQCKPTIAGWEFFTKGKCLSLLQMSRAAGYLNIVTDFLIVVLPMPLIWKLQLRPLKTLGVTLIFATGFIVVAVAIVRQVYVVGHANEGDLTVQEMDRNMWQNVELNVGIVGVCLPFFGAFSKKLPDREYFTEKYDSLRSWLRTSRSRSIGGNYAGPSGSTEHWESSDYSKSVRQVRTERAGSDST